MWFQYISFLIVPYWALYLSQDSIPPMVCFGTTTSLDYIITVLPVLVGNFCFPSHFVSAVYRFITKA